jgi:hypothetical protein
MAKDIGSFRDSQALSWFSGHQTMYLLLETRKIFSSHSDMYLYVDCNIENGNLNWKGQKPIHH